MNKANFLKIPLTAEPIHEGEGLCPHANVLPGAAFQTPVSFVNYTILPPGASFGMHAHGNDNEMYIVLSGTGEYSQNDETEQVEPGHIFVNAPFASHSIKNTGTEDMRLLVIEVTNEKGSS